MIRIGVAQTRNSMDVWRNGQRAAQLIGDLAGRGADLVVFPECYLSGFSPALRTADFDLIEATANMIERVCRWYGVACLLPSAVEREGRILNGGFWITPSAPRCDLFKESLMSGEEKLFSTRPNGRRYFEWKNIRIGFLICKEASDPTWSLLDIKDVPDLLLWPGVWGWQDRPEWNDNLDKLSKQVFLNHKEWKIPLLQANHSGYERGDTRKPPRGASIVVDANGMLKYAAPLDQEASFVVDFRRGASWHLEVR